MISLFYYVLIFIVVLGIFYAVTKAAVLSALEDFEYDKKRKKTEKTED